MTKPGEHEVIDGATIMVVEDEAIVALDLSLSLEDGGASVVGPFHHLPQALECPDLAEIDAAILDVDINGVNVFPLAERLRDANVPMLFHTARSEFDPSPFRAAALCPKPCMSARLITRLGRLMLSQPGAGLKVNATAG